MGLLDWPISAIIVIDMNIRNGIRKRTTTTIKIIMNTSMTNNTRASAVANGHI